MVYPLAICLIFVVLIAVYALLAQLDRVAGFEPVGRGFESLRAHFSIFTPDKLFMIWRLLLTVFVFAQFTIQFCAAQEQVYSWTDDAGNVHYGNKPPEGQKAETVAATLSRYDSKKLIDKLKSAAATAVGLTKEPQERDNAEAGEESDDEPGAGESPKVAARTPADKSGRVAVHGVNAAIDASDNLNVLHPLEDLEAGDIQIKYDNNFNIISCQAVVRNIGDKDQHGIAVVFDFKDSSKVVAEGPVTLAPGEEGTYIIPDELLPFGLKQKYRDKNISGAGLTKKQIKEKLTPDVRIGL